MLSSSFVVTHHFKNQISSTEIEFYNISTIFNMFFLWKDLKKIFSLCEPFYLDSKFGRSFYQTLCHHCNFSEIKNQNRLKRIKLKFNFEVLKFLFKNTLLLITIITLLEVQSYHCYQSFGISCCFSAMNIVNNNINDGDNNKSLKIHQDKSTSRVSWCFSINSNI